VRGVKVTIKGIVPKWPLISWKETASEYDKINNCAMIRPSPLCDNWRSVAQHDNISHLFPLLLTGHVVTYIVLIKGGASERCDFSQFGKRQFSYGIYTSVWLRRGCLFAWRTDGHNSGFFRRWMEICEWKHEYKVHRLHATWIKPEVVATKKSIVRQMLYFFES
jgi:hypothetical protein